jgi:hypothetical protein
LAGSEIGCPVAGTSGPRARNSNTIPAADRMTIFRISYSFHSTVLQVMIDAQKPSGIDTSFLASALISN